jgi:metal-responsive CopG/Arc/MetJ family transcriptional regulator
MTSAPRPKRTERLQVILPADEVAAIDAFRYQARMPSRAEAVRELLRRGLASVEEEL